VTESFEARAGFSAGADDDTASEAEPLPVAEGAGPDGFALLQPATRRRNRIADGVVRRIKHTRNRRLSKTRKGAPATCPFSLRTRLDLLLGCAL